jgi:uncharacterized protein YdeI (YjbR/CyaY-like superfamily)
MDIKFFASQSAFRAWLEKHHDGRKELLVGFYKKGSGKPSITYPESVDAALCFGWIDGVRASVDDTTYSVRFTPRRPGSVWSDVNIKRAQALTDQGLMRPAGVAAFEARVEAKTAVYAYEQRGSAKLDEALERRFRANKKAWAFFSAQAPWYRRTASWWVISAKREETRLKRLGTLIEDSEHGRPIGPLARPARSK